MIAASTWNRSVTSSSPTRRGRHEPGRGDLPLARWVSELEAAGYTGWLALEYEPADDTWSGLSRLTPFDGRTTVVS